MSYWFVIANAKARPALSNAVHPASSMKGEREGGGRTQVSPAVSPAGDDSKEGFLMQV